MIATVISFVVLIMLLIIAGAVGNRHFLTLTMILCIVLPVVVSYFVLSTSDGGTEGWAESIGQVLFMALVVILSGIRFIVKGTKTKDASLLSLGIGVALVQIVVLVAFVALLSSGIRKVGG